MSNSTNLAVAVALTAVLCFGCRSEAPTTETPPMTTTAERIPIGDVSWFTDYDAAVAHARAEQKPLWMHFGEDPG